MKKKKLQNIFLNLMTSGTMSRLELIPRYQLIFANAVGILGTVILLFFSASSLLSGNLSIGLSTAITGTAILIVMVLTRFIRTYRFMRYFFAFILLFLFLYLAYTGGTEGSGVFWALAYPIMALFLLGARMGTLVSALFWISTSLFLFIPSLNLMEFSQDYAMRYLGAYLTIYIFAFTYQITMEQTQRDLQETTRNLAREKEQTDSIMNHVEQGLFLLEEDFKIGDAHSKSLNELIMTDTPEGKGLMDILRPYLGPQDYQASEDYLNMFYRDDVNPDLLKEINPLEEVRISSADGKEEKILRFGFGKVSRGKEEPAILGFVADISEEFRLQAQLKEDQASYSRSIEQLFQIIHVEPLMLQDFLNQTHREMEQINTLLKANVPEPRTVLQHIYQILHGIKGNALLLGLETLGKQIHTVEDLIKQSREKETQWDDLLDVTLALGNLQQIFGEMEELVERIQSFSTHRTPLAESNSETPQHSPLIAALEDFVQREACSQGKEVILNTEKLQLDQFPEKIQPLIKDISIQLIRNSLAHGIEDPAERKEIKKTEQGSIVLWSDIENGQLIFHYRDDGKGLNPVEIRQKALERKIHPDEKLLAMKDPQVVGLIFHPEFSTQSSSDMSAGRGMGMSVIRDKARQAGARLKLASKAGQYSQFSFLFTTK